MIQKIKFWKDNAKSDTPRYNLYDPRSSSDRQLDESNLEILKTKLSSLIPNSEDGNELRHPIFYSAAVNTAEPSSKLKSMFYATFTSASTNHGKRFESHVRDLYKKTMTDQSFQINVAEVGFKVSHTQPYFATSLDGIVSCKSEIWGLEIKCPFSKYNFPMDDAIKDRNLFLKHTSEGVKLSRRHKYYFQVQGEMFCANLRRVDFVVWFGDNKPLFIESIFFDEDFVLNFILPRLKFFYYRAILPEFFTRRVQPGLKLYLQDGWVSYE